MSDKSSTSKGGLSARIAAMQAAEKAAASKTTTAKKSTAAAKSTAKKTTAAKKTTTAKTTAKKTTAAKKTTSGSSVKVTATEKKLLELYRAANAQTKKEAMEVLKADTRPNDSLIEAVLANKDLRKTLTDMFKTSLKK